LLQFLKDLSEAAALQCFFVTKQFFRARNARAAQCANVLIYLLISKLH